MESSSGHTWDENMFSYPILWISPKFSRCRNLYLVLGLYYRLSELCDYIWEYEYVYLESLSYMQYIYSLLILLLTSKFKIISPHQAHTPVIRYGWGVIYGRPSRWLRSKTWRSPSSPQIHQKYIYMWNNSYRTLTERWQKTSDLPKGKKLPTYLGRAKEKRNNRDKRIGMGGFPGGAVVENLPANAGDTGSSPGLGRSHMPRSN